MLAIAVGIAIIAVFLYYAPEWGGLAITALVILIGLGDMFYSIGLWLIQLVR